MHVKMKGKEENFYPTLWFNAWLLTKVASYQSKNFPISGDNWNISFKPKLNLSKILKKIIIIWENCGLEAKRQNVETVLAYFHIPSYLGKKVAVLV